MKSGVNMLYDYIKEILDQHRGKALGIVLGLIFGWFAISYGFFKAIFVALCVIGGYIIGKGVDEHFDFRDLLSRLFKDRW